MFALLLLLLVVVHYSRAWPTTLRAIAHRLLVVNVRDNQQQVRAHTRTQFLFTNFVRPRASFRAINLDCTSGARVATCKTNARHINLVENDEAN